MLEGFWIRNFRVLKQIAVGTCFPQFSYIDDWSAVLPYELRTVTFFTGANGTGKSSLIDAFAFISDCLGNGIDFACQKRGGYDAVYSLNGKGALSFGFLYRQKGEIEPVTYAVSIACSAERIPYIESELLAYRRGKESVPIFFLQNGLKSIRYLAPDERIGNAELTKIEFTDFKHLGLQALETHPRFPVLESVRKLFADWTLCNFTPDPARGLDASLPRKIESQRGNNLSALMRYLVNRYGDSCPHLLERITPFLPDVEKILMDIPQPDRIHLSFKVAGQERPVPVTLMSTADIRLFTYSLLLEENESAPLVVIEEPENGLDRRYRTSVLELFGKAMNTSRNTQLFTTVLEPEILDAVHPSQVWRLNRDKNNIVFVERASDSLHLSEQSGLNISPHWFTEMMPQQEET